MKTDLDHVFWSNIGWHLEQTVVQIQHANNVRGRARSGYYKAALLFSSAIIEALAHRILQRAIDTGLTTPEQSEDYEHHLLPGQFAVDGYRVVVCKRKKVNFRLLPNTDFVRVNQVAKEMSVFPKRLYNKVERIRRLRNKIHLQGLNYVDRKHRLHQVDYIADVMVALVSMAK